MRRSSLPHFGRWLAGLAVLALLASAVPGDRRIALCVSTDGHLDLKHVTQECHGCARTVCDSELVGGEAAPAPAPSPSPSPGAPFADSCCYDIPLDFDLVGWLPAREAAGEVAACARLAVLPALPTCPEMPPAPDAGATCRERPPARESVALASLGCIILLL